MIRDKKILIQDGIVNTLKYFDYFSFPLTFSELHKFIDVKCSAKDMQFILNIMVAEERIYMIDNVYLISNTVEKTERKLKGRISAVKKIKRARIIAQLIGLFPFVRSVSISGSLSKMYADKNSDIDFFITTNEGNLWTCRTVLHLLKKISFLFNLQHSFCMNYFISNSNLLLEEQNYFTAIELSTLMPLYGRTDYDELMRINKWMYGILPNYESKENESKSISKNLFKRFAEFLLSSSRLNLFFLNSTNKRWRKKWSKNGYNMEDYDLALKTTLNVSKNHPMNYQKLVLKHKNEK